MAHWFKAQSDSTTNQSTSKFVYQNLDTLKSYSVSLLSKSSGNKTEYWVNKKPVDANTYNKYKTVWDNIDKCTPCYMQTYDVNDVLLSESINYEDCVIGQKIDYDSNGRITLISNYKMNDTENWENLWNRGYCSVPDGTWTYYNKKGEVVKTKQYQNGKLLK